MKKICLMLLGVILIIGGFVLLTQMGKLKKGTHNDYSAVCGYFDEDRKYLSDISMEFNLQRDEKYEEKINLSNNKKYKLHVAKNDISNNFHIELKDSASNSVFGQDIKSNQNQIILGNKEIEGGQYTLEISLKAGTKGTMEIKVDEQ